MSKGDSENLRVRLGEPLKAAFDRLLADKRITQQAAVIAMVEWLIAQNPLSQSMVLGQIPRDDVEVMRLALARAEAEAAVHKTKKRSDRQARAQARRRNTGPDGAAA